MASLMPSAPIPFDASVTESMIRLEADRIYRSLFGTEVPDIIRTRFAEPSALLNSRSVSRDVQHYYHAIEHIRDLEALEVAARYARRLPMISQKFRLMVYLAETLPQNQSHFVNHHNSFWLGVVAILSGGVRSAWKILKGLTLLRSLPDA